MSKTDLKEILNFWSYKGQKLNNPFAILIRLIAWPLIFVFAIPLYLILWVVWGKDAAESMWETVT